MPGLNGNDPTSEPDLGALLPNLVSEEVLCLTSDGLSIPGSGLTDVPYRSYGLSQAMNRLRPKRCSTCR